MRISIGAVLSVALALGLAGRIQAADDTDVKAVLDKAIKALGGEDKLSKNKGASWKTKGTITIMGADNPFTVQGTVQGLDHYRGAFEGEFGGNTVKGLTVIAGDKGWRQFGDMMTELDKDAITNEKRNVYLLIVPTTLLPLKGKGFKVKAAAEEKVGGKPAAVLDVTGPDGKTFKLFFDKGSGLPVKMVAKVLDFMGNEFTQETTYADYKEFGGIKKATKVDSKRDGEKFLTSEVTEYKPLEKVDPKSFAEPK
jgi:hypothetical protein